MGSDRRRPTHSLEEAKRLAAQGDFTINGRSRQFIINHMGACAGVRRVVAGVVLAILPEHFEKSVPLRRVDGQWGDVYRFVPYAGEEWYVKLFLGGDGSLALNVMSANWEGYIH